MKKLDKLKFQGEECYVYNRDNPISEVQFRTISIIEKYFKDVFNGHTFGEAWDFIGRYIGEFLVEDNRKAVVPLEFGMTDGKIESENSYLENLEIVVNSDINFQEDYFRRRYEALRGGEVWTQDDRLFDETIENPHEKEMVYDINEDDEQLD